MAVVVARGAMAVRGQRAEAQVEKRIANRRPDNAQQDSQSDGNNDLARESVGGHNE